ncbi:MAG: hypothetical protein ACREK5_08365 [Gemmatimonadota bacterium]
MMRSASFRMPTLSALIAFLLLGCGGSDSGPMAPGGGDLPNVAGAWFVNRTVESTSCGPVGVNAINVLVTQQGEDIQIATELQLGPFNYAGTIERDGDFGATFSGLITGAGVILDANLSGRFTSNSLSATETLQLTEAQSGDACSLQIRWLGNPVG